MYVCTYVRVCMNIIKYMNICFIYYKGKYMQVSSSVVCMHKQMTCMTVLYIPTVCTSMYYMCM